MQPTPKTTDVLLDIYKATGDNTREAYLSILEHYLAELKRAGPDNQNAEDQKRCEWCIQRLTETRSGTSHVFKQNPDSERLVAMRKSQQSLSAICDKLTKMTGEGSSLGEMQRAETELNVINKTAVGRGEAPISEAAGTALRGTLKRLRERRDQILESQRKLEVEFSAENTLDPSEEDFRRGCQTAADFLWDKYWPGRLCFLVLRYNIPIMFSRQGNILDDWDDANGAFSLQSLFIATVDYHDSKLNNKYWDLRVRSLYLVIKNYAPLHRAIGQALEKGSLCQKQQHIRLLLAADIMSATQGESLKTTALSRKLGDSVDDEFDAAQVDQRERAARLATLKVKDSDARALAKVISSSNGGRFPTAVDLFTLARNEVILREVMQNVDITEEKVSIEVEKRLAAVEKKRKECLDPAAHTSKPHSKKDGLNLQRPHKDSTDLSHKGKGNNSTIDLSPTGNEKKPNDVKRTESQSKNVDRERSVRLFPVSRRRLEMPQLRLDHPQRVGERQNQKPSSQLVRKAPFHGSRFTEEMEVPPRLSGAPLPGKPKLVVLVPGQSMPVSKEGSESESASSRYHRALETEEMQARDITGSKAAPILPQPYTYISHGASFRGLTTMSLFQEPQIMSDGEGRNSHSSSSRHYDRLTTSYKNGTPTPERQRKPDTDTEGEIDRIHTNPNASYPHVDKRKPNVFSRVKAKLTHRYRSRSGELDSRAASSGFMVKIQ